MHPDRRLLGWGVFFVLLGTIPLAVQSGAFPREVVAQSWRLWPLILIGGGIGILLRGTRAAAIGGVVTAVTFGIIGGSVLAGAVDIGAVGCGGGPPSGQTFQNGGDLGATASVDIDMRCGDLTVRSVDGAAWSISGQADPDDRPDISADGTSVSLDSGSRGFFIPGIGTSRAKWDVGLPRSSTIDLDTTLNAGQATLALGGAKLGSIDLTTNAGSLALDLQGATVGNGIELTVNAGETRIVLPSSSLTGSMTVNAGSLRVCVAPDVGLRLRTNENLTAAFDFPGLTRDGSTWTSPNFASASAKIDLTATANAGSITLNPGSGCR